MLSILPYSLRQTAQPEQRRLRVGSDIMPYTQSSLAVPKKPVTIAVQDKGTVSADAMSRYNTARASQGSDASYMAANRISIIAVRLRVKKKVKNLSAMWYKEFAKNFATQGDFGHESP